MTRRQFIYSSALAAGAAALTGCTTPRRRRVTANDKLNIGVIGAGGKGASDTDCCAGENIVALCDVDEKIATSRRKKYPNARFYQDFRKMLDQEKSLDAVIVSTPDHTHAVAAATAMRMGKHVYCQKPLTHSIYEARLLRKLAKQCKVATQMGNQGSAEDGLRRAVEIIQAGLIGPVRQVYVWTNRPIWPQGMDRPPGSDPVPASLDWDGWIGPAPLRPYKAEWPDKSATGDRPSVCVARLAGLRHRRARRHGVPHGQHAFPGTEAGISDGNRGCLLGHEQRELPAQIHHPLRISLPRPPFAGHPLVV
jgi:hypothetical protein